MITVIGLGLLAMSMCLALQALASVLAARYFAHARTQPMGRKPWRRIFLQFSVLMIVLMLGNILQVAFWALLYRALGAFEDFETAMYFRASPSRRLVMATWCLTVVSGCLRRCRQPTG